MKTLVAVLVLGVALLVEGRPDSADAITPFQKELCTALGSYDCNGVPSSFTVPAKHVTIRFASGQCLTTGTIWDVQLTTTVGGDTVGHLVVPFMAIQNDVFSFAQETQIFADRGTDVSLGVSGSGDGKCIVRVSGSDSISK
jgi:hypothetical protein